MGILSDPFFVSLSSQIHLTLTRNIIPCYYVDTEEFHHFSERVYILSILGLIFNFTDVFEARKDNFFEFVIIVTLYSYCNLYSLISFVLPLSLIQWFFSNFIVQQSQLKCFLKHGMLGFKPSASYSVGLG